MSHVRNLFHRTLVNTYAPVSTTEAAAAAVAPASGAAVVAPSPRDFPVVEARVRPEHRVVFHTDPRGPAADRFRLLRMRLREFSNAGKLKKLLVTSPLAHDGKSTITLNLATALCERGKRSVLVLDADLHHSALTEGLGLSPWIGLTECLSDEATAPLSAIRRVEPFGWHLLPAGEPRRNPTELLQSLAFGNLVQQLSESCDWVLIDSPPAIAITDTISMQHNVDGTLLVVRMGRTPREAVDEAIELLGKKKILGVILNGVEPLDHLYYQYRRYDGNRDHSED